MFNILITQWHLLFPSSSNHFSAPCYVCTFLIKDTPFQKPFCKLTRLWLPLLHSISLYLKQPMLLVVALVTHSAWSTGWNHSTSNGFCWPFWEWNQLLDSGLELPQAHDGATMGNSVHALLCIPALCLKGCINCTPLLGVWISATQLCALTASCCCNRLMKAQLPRGNCHWTITSLSWKYNTAWPLDCLKCTSMYQFSYR